MADVSSSQSSHAAFNPVRGEPASSHRQSPDRATKSPERPETSPGGGLDPTDIRAALAQLFASPPFRKSAQLTNFLRFVVEETLAGRGDRIKAYTIATAALGRDETFDPQADPIVRVEAARLRRALRSYYANGGADDAIVVELPTGTYTPVFRPLRPQRRSAVTWLHDIAGEFTTYVRENWPLLLVIFLIAVAVCLAFEIIDTVIFDAK